MSVDVGATVVIERPIEEVSAFAGDPSNAPRWYRRISSAEWETDPPISLGSRIAFRARFMGRDLEYVYEVIEYTPGEQVAMRTAEGPFPMATTYTWRPVGSNTTHMTLRNHGEPSGFSRLAAPLVARAMRRAMNQDLADLKQLLESG
ncbi:SRPBCC family protein [Ilumatobacter sp.]|uniref:SRPBCC family protein n=1 Tax=Ilumatobacter sp. TaxID=1967498 RepID=UPI003AF683CD